MGFTLPAAPPDHGNIYDLLTRAAAADPDHIVCRLGDQVMTRGDLADRASAVAHALQPPPLLGGDVLDGLCNFVRPLRRDDNNAVTVSQHVISGPDDHATA